MLNASKKTLEKTEDNPIHYLLRCRLYSVQRAELLNGICKLDSTPQNFSEDHVLTVWYGSEKFALNVNKEIIRFKSVFAICNDKL